MFDCFSIQLHRRTAENNKSVFQDGASEQEDSPAETEPQTKKGRKSKEERAAEKSKKHEEKKEKKKGNNQSILLTLVANAV